MADCKNFLGLTPAEAIRCIDSQILNAFGRTSEYIGKLTIADWIFGFLMACSFFAQLISYLWIFVVLGMIASRRINDSHIELMRIYGFFMLFVGFVNILWSNDSSGDKFLFYTGAWEVVSGFSLMNSL